VATVHGADEATLKDAHDGAVQSVSFDPQGKYLATLGGVDGKLKVWDWQRERCVQEHQCLPRSSSGSEGENLLRSDWSENGAILAVPSQRQVLVIKRNEWTNTTHILGGGHQRNVSIVSVSPCGQYLASASVDGEVVLWDIQAKTVIRMTSSFYYRSFPFPCPCPCPYLYMLVFVSCG
jgi:chromosome transmission fidelity protein 4